MPYNPLYCYGREFKVGLKGKEFGKRVAEMSRYELICYIGVLLLKLGINNGVDKDEQERKPREEGLCG